MANHTTPLTLQVNHSGPFTYHYALWPYVCLLCIMGLVWCSVYLSILRSRRHHHHHPTTARRRLSSIFATHDMSTTLGNGESSLYETLTVPLASHV